MNPDSVRKARMWLAVVFVVGAAIGAVFGYSFGHRGYDAALATSKPPLSEPERRAHRVADMTKELGLTPEQSLKADEVIRQAHQEMKAIRDKSEQDVDAVRQKARNQMRAFLTPEQLPKFEAMVQRMDQQRKAQQPPGPPPK
jgi:Spy/CpxP family protein refolding chaperone